MTPMWKSRKFWAVFAAGVTAAGAQILPLLAFLLKLSPEQQMAFTSACQAVSALVAGLGGVLCMGIAVEDHGAKMCLPPPAPTEEPKGQ